MRESFEYIKEQAKWSAKSFVKIKVCNLKLLPKKI